MHSRRTLCGHLISLNNKDRVVLDNKLPLECMIKDAEKRPKLILRITNFRKKYDCETEPGIDVRLTSQHVEVLLKPKTYQQLITNGHYSSRSFIDRIDMNYWQPGMNT